MDEATLIQILTGTGGFLVGVFGGKALPFLRFLAKGTPTKLDDTAVELAQKFIDAEASKDK